MKGFAPGLLDRLMGERAQVSAGGANAYLSVDQVKDSIARDLEALLNTRLAIPEHVFDAYPQARRSILNYGLVDFAGLCLASTEDREAICASLKAAIEIHEPRLSDVTASLEAETGNVNRLQFVINAKLQLHAAAEPVNFNAVLQPSTLHYSISKAARSSRT
ncbi:type VI secretion system baseplate subunit TssE [Massilia horti]|uniref:Type VI secretion system baseplate subunit TssE n=1 Tax=Massilia horti TaxID=2562153 RepID=A0A4Y9T770_9BURK|nr:type VI secretion system baseplate subunit TssE [Massilia horti]TFW33370.1 type VI secretion system baseplate subunit TssE [Massilia horti]